MSFLGVSIVGILICGPLQVRSDVQKALESLAAPSRADRQVGLEVIARLVDSDEAVRSRTDIQMALASMVVEENRRLVGAASTNAAEDDPFLESYYFQLTPAALAVLPYATGKAESALLKALIDSFFNTRSRFSKALAGVGEPAARITLELPASGRPTERAKAYDLLGQMLANSAAKKLRQPLSQGSESAARAAILKGLRDPDIVCRREAVRAVESARLIEAVPVLLDLAAHDPDDGRGGNGPVRFSVRGLAAKAIATLSPEQ